MKKQITIGYIASTKGIKSREDPTMWYNPVEAIKDQISQELKDKVIEINITKTNKDSIEFDDFEILSEPTTEEIMMTEEINMAGYEEIPDAPILLNELPEEIPKEIIYSHELKESEENSIFTKLSLIQTELKVGKDKVNTFGKFNYRSTSDILEAIKPLLKKYSVAITITDRLLAIGNRFYIEATATISDNQNSISTSALARETDEKKGMDSAQVTGATSSYARKYALNGLLAIDDTKDIDEGNHGN